MSQRPVGSIAAKPCRWSFTSGTARQVKRRNTSWMAPEFSSQSSSESAQVIVVQVSDHIFWSRLTRSSRRSRAFSMASWRLVGSISSVMYMVWECLST